MTAAVPAARVPEATRPKDFQLRVRTSRDDRRALRGALRSEGMKVRTLRSNKAILVVTAVVGGLVSWGVASVGSTPLPAASEVFVYSTVFTSVLAAIAGVLMFTSEVQHGTLALTLTRQPVQSILVGSKAVVAAGFGALLGAAGLVFGYIVGVLVGLRPGAFSALATSTIWTLVFTALAAVLGLGVGMVARHSAGAIAGVLVWSLVLEHVFSVALPDHISRFLPFIAGNNIIGIQDNTGGPANASVVLSHSQNALVFAVYAIVFLLVGTCVLSRGDAA